MIVEMIFHSESWARGFAEGVEHVNDGAITNIEVKRRDTGRAVEWVVTFEDEDAKEEKE